MGGKDEANCLAHGAAEIDTKIPLETGEPTDGPIGGERGGHGKAADRRAPRGALGPTRFLTRNNELAGSEKTRLRAHPAEETCTRKCHAER